MVTCWKRADLLAFVGYVYCIFVTFSCGILGEVWYLIVSFPDLCHLFYFVVASFKGAKVHATVGVWHKTLSLRDVTLKDL